MTSNPMAEILNKEAADWHKLYMLERTLRRRHESEIEQLRALLTEAVGWEWGQNIEWLRRAREALRGAVETAQPKRPVAWFRIPEDGEPILVWGNWPPPEPDDTTWAPLYSSPEGRPYSKTTSVATKLAEPGIECLYKVICGRCGRDLTLAVKTAKDRMLRLDGYICQCGARTEITPENREGGT